MKYKYHIIYLVLIIIASLSMFNLDNYYHPKFEVSIILLASVLGVIFINYHLKHQKELYKTAFIVLLVFGLLCSFLTPIDSVSDEWEHFTRSEITSRGILFPDYSNSSFQSIASINDFKNLTDKTFFEIQGQPINTTPIDVESAFQQNPFYGYVVPSIGINVAKLLDLDSVWMLWFGRFFNVLLYAGLISLAIRKTPILKMPIFAIASLPVCLYQAYSISIDSFVAGLGIYTVCYFFNMCVNRFDKKDIIIFTALSLITGLAKLPYLGLVFLLLAVPHDNFTKKNYYIYCLAAILFAGAIGFLWSHFYATDAVLHSWRGNYLASQNVNVTSQITYIFSHPFEFTVALAGLINTIPIIFNGFFNLYAYTIEGGEYVASYFISTLLTLFVGFLAFLSNDKRIDLKTRTATLITFIIIYVGTYIVQLLSWSPVGDLSFSGVHTRYFLVLFAILPFIFGVNVKKDKKIDNYIFILSIFFISCLLISLAVKFY